MPAIEYKDDNPIRASRIVKEKKLCEQSIEWSKSQYNSDLVRFPINGGSSGSIVLTQQYPFQQPYLRFELAPNLFTHKNLEQYQPYDYYFPKRLWTPKLTVDQIIQNSSQFMTMQVVQRSDQVIDPITNFIYMIRCRTSELTTSTFIILLTVLLRILVGLGSYSGYNDPPRYGDYEAQRHWMELATNSSPVEWYHESDFNDFKWWRLDYPPLSGYFAYIVGLLIQVYDPSSVEPIYSRGYESMESKNFMRWSVILSDLVFFYPISIILLKQKLSKFSFDYQWGSILLFLSCPILIIIDHGHFQYNCIGLGLTMIGAYLCMQDNLVFGSIVFTCALLFKQMNLYYSLAFFAFIIGKIALLSNLRSQHRLSLHKQRIPHFIAYILLIGLVVVITTLLIFIPWLSSIESFKEVIDAVFPIHRGLYELKVGTFWCISHIVIKWEYLFSNSTLMLLSVLMIVLFSIPAMLCLIINNKAFPLGLYIISQTFFLFGFQVHEKTILIPLVWLMMEFRKTPCEAFITFAGLTLYPLMKEDGLAIQFMVIWVGYQVLQQKYQINNPIIKTIKVKDQDSTIIQQLSKLILIIQLIYQKYVVKFMKCTMWVFILVEQLIEPPLKYPFLYPLIYSTIGFIAFSVQLILSNIQMIKTTLTALQKSKVE